MWKNADELPEPAWKQFFGPPLPEVPHGFTKGDQVVWKPGPDEWGTVDSRHGQVGTYLHADPNYRGSGFISMPGVSHPLWVMHSELHPHGVPGLAEHPDPWMDNEPGSLTIPKEWDPSQPKQAMGPPSFDPFTCSKCLTASMSEPKQLAPGKWIQTCAKCSATRMISPTHPLVKMVTEMVPPYPRELMDAGPVRPMVASSDPEDELHVGLDIPEDITKKIKAWVDEQDWPEGTELEDPSEYHITLLYVPDGWAEFKDADWLYPASDGYDATITGLDDSFGEDPKKKATVLRIEGDDLLVHANDLLDMAENHGLSVKRFPGGYRAHLTLAYGPGKPPYARCPKLKFKTKPSRVSTPRGLHKSSWVPDYPPVPESPEAGDYHRCPQCGDDYSSELWGMNAPEGSPEGFSGVQPGYDRQSCGTCGFQRTVPRPGSDHDPLKWQYEKPAVEHPLKWGAIHPDASAIMQYAEEVDPKHILPYREYDWSRDKNREGREAWDSMRDDIARNGFKEPAFLEFNHETGHAYLGEGNHRAGMAQELGIPLPVVVYRSRKTAPNYPMKPIAQPGQYSMLDERGFSNFPQYARPSDIGLPTVQVQSPHGSQSQSPTDQDPSGREGRATPRPPRTGGPRPATAGARGATRPSYGSPRSAGSQDRTDDYFAGRNGLWPGSRELRGSLVEIPSGRAGRPRHDQGDGSLLRTSDEDYAQSHDLVAAGRSAAQGTARGSRPGEQGHRLGEAIPWGDQWDDDPYGIDLSSDTDWDDQAYDEAFNKHLTQPPELRPWSRGQDGKGLIGQDGKLHVWATDPYGIPHHDIVSQYHNIPYQSKIDVLPTGKAYVQDHETAIPTDDAYKVIKEQGGRHGIWPASGGGYFAGLLDYYHARRASRIHSRVLDVVSESLSAKHAGDELPAHGAPARSSSAEAQHGGQGIGVRQRHGMAIRPGDLQGIIAQHGPYAYHLTDPSSRPGILQNGLIPWDHPENPNGTAYNGALVPRPGHVYMSLKKPGLINPAVGVFPEAVAIDLRKLDPQHINPDEDAIGSYGYSNPNAVPPGLEGMSEEIARNRGYNVQKSWGQSAEEHDFGADPDHTKWGINAMPNIAYRGIIPPHAIIPAEQVPEVFR